MTPTLSKDDWIEIASAVAIRMHWLREYLPEDEEEVQVYDEWADHLKRILDTIGGDGEAMWPKED